MGEIENAWQKNVLPLGVVIAATVCLVCLLFFAFLLFVWTSPYPERGFVFIVILVALVLMMALVNLRHPRWVLVDEDGIKLRDGFGRELTVKKDYILSIKLIDNQVPNIYHIEFRSPDGGKGLRVLSKDCGKAVVERMKIEEERMVKPRLF